MKIALTIEYDGAPYCGWQTQATGCGVQDFLQVALTHIAGEPIQLHAAGRTDSGVHALAQVVHFETRAQRPLSAWVRGANALLPNTIRVRWASPVSATFHARFSASQRRYRYLVYNAPIAPALWHGKVGWFHAPLDATLMQEAARGLIGEHDFSSFRAAECQARSAVKQLQTLAIARCGPLIVLDFAANAFLHHMVRNIVGALVYVGSRRQPCAWIDELLLARDRTRAAPTFAAAGLYLSGVSYPTEFALPQASSAALDALIETIANV